VLACTWLVATAATAHAAFPGENGKIAFDGCCLEGLNLDHIYLVDPDGSNRERISGAGTSYREPAFSADGERMAFTRFGPLGELGIWTINADGTDETRLTEGGSGPAFSPDGQKVAFHRFGETSQDIWVADADGSGEVQLTDNDQSEVFPTFSPDGQKIAFAKAGDIWVMNANGTGGVNLTQDGAGPNTDGDPEFSPDGETIAYQSNDSGNGVDLWAMNANGGGATNLTQSPGVDEIRPAFSPDGERIAFQRGISLTVSRVWVMNADGTGQESIAGSAAEDPNDDARAPSWQPIVETGLVVNDTGDGADANKKNGRCDADPDTGGNQCTLRAAIQEANKQEGANEIGFDIDPGGVQTIEPRKSLPAITDEVTIDGSTQPTATAGEPGIHLDGTEARAKRGIGDSIALALDKGSARSVIKSLAIGSFDIGALIRDKQVAMQSNWFGMLAGDALARNGTGIRIEHKQATIGGPGDLGNVVSGATDYGIRLQGDLAKLAAVAGNTIGPPPDLSPNPDFVSNLKAGIALVKGASKNTIGGETPAEGNVIGNNGIGVLLKKVGQLNELSRNSIGVPPTAGANSELLANIGDGVLVKKSLLERALGPTTIILNSIANNRGHGLAIVDSAGIEVSGNALGQIYAAAACAGSGVQNAVSQLSVRLTKSLRAKPKLRGKLGKLELGKLGPIVIGGLQPVLASAGGNLACGKTGGGGGGLLGKVLDLAGLKDSLLKVEVTGNEINGGAGVLLENLKAKLEENTISESSAAGVAVQGNKTKGLLSQNQIFDNIGRSIELVKGAGDLREPDPLDPDKGPNGLQNYGFFGFVKRTLADTGARISLLSEPKTKYRIEMFASDECGPEGQGEGEQFLGSEVVETNRRGLFNAVFDELDFDFGAIADPIVSMTVTKLGKGKGTSEHSECQAVIPEGDPAVGIAPLDLFLKRGKVKTVVDCLDTSACVGAIKLLDRDNPAIDYGQVEDIAIDPGQFENVRVALNQAGLDKLEQDRKLAVDLAADLGALQEQVKAMLQQAR